MKWSVFISPLYTLTFTFTLPCFFLIAPKSEKSKKVKKEKDPSKSLDEVRLDPELLRAANKVAQDKFK